MARVHPIPAGASSELRGVPARRTPAPARVVIQDVSPEIDSGRFAVKRDLGEQVAVSARIFADGQDSLAAAVRYRRRHEALWREAAMTPEPDDLWRGSFGPEELGSYEYTVAAWIDRFATWRKETGAKVEAGLDCSREFIEGAALVDDALTRAAPGDSRALRRWVAALRVGARADRSAAARDAGLARLMARCGERNGLVVYDRVLRASVERERARFGAWYEMFPRSAGGGPRRGATFREAEARLPGVAAMGFDVLYLPPIHPIGKTARKGPNNEVRAGPDDPGSPWAIGSEAGGHKAVHPGLGTLADFDHFLAAAEGLGLEIALDVAFQCSPDHPYVQEHPGWFHHRLDGSVKYAENPPKKYEDIYPFDFECADWRALWDELIDVVLFWSRRGVRAFRVDNPHTKPFRFWKELIHAVHAEFPETIFLAEAFTRPAVMRHLAKCGFSQSYTYFIWRSTKEELTSYFTELTKTEVREYLRPNLFVNTPDILHSYLQTGGRPAHQTRLVLAATLGSSYGVYGPPFELCEALPIPGTEEYADAEKYRIRRWDWDRPGNIRDFIARVNRIRGENPALRRDETLRFLTTDNDQLIAYAKTTADLSNVLVVVVNLDPRNVQSGWIQVPWRDWGLAENEVHPVDDLLQDARYSWQGASNFIRLDPRVCPAHVLRLSRPLRKSRIPAVRIDGCLEDPLGPSTRSVLEASIIPAFLARQRWYAGKARSIRALRIGDAARLGRDAAPLYACLVSVSYDDGGEETYSMPLSVVAGPAADRIRASHPESVLALLESRGRTAALCDAPADDDSCRTLFEAIRDQAQYASERGRILAVKTDAFSRIARSSEPPPVERGSTEHSNSSLRYGNLFMLKLFRRLQPGVNPELEIGRALAARRHFNRTPRIAGALELQRAGQEPLTLAVLQELIANEGDGWSYALDELRLYFDGISASRPSRRRRPATAVVDSWLRSARTLGRRTAELHKALAEDLGDPAFTPEPFASADLARMARRIEDDSNRALAALERGIDALAPELRAEASKLLGMKAALASKLDVAAIDGIPKGKIRCHGDYHLGQTLRTGDDFCILDFEGEPARPIAQRRMKQSPLRDVAGMLRSFDYAADAGLLAFTAAEPAERAHLEPWARSWRDWTSAAFLGEYKRTAANAGFLPAAADQFERLLDLFMLEKAFYELAYELDDRPGWAGIPLQGLLRLLEPRAT